MTPDEYNSLHPRAAREQARRLPANEQLRLAVALSATRSPCGVGAVYTFWLRLWANEEKKSAIVQESFL
jgi:hypothetical protein